MNTTQKFTFSFSKSRYRPLATPENFLWRGILDKNVIRSYHKVHYIEFVCMLSYGPRYAVMSYSVMLYCIRNTVVLYSCNIVTRILLYRTPMLMYHPIAIDRNFYAVVSYSESSYRNLNDVVSYLVNLYRNLIEVVSPTLTIDGIQEIVMSYTATVYYSRDAEHFIDIFTVIYKFLCGPIRSFYMKDQIFLPFHIQCTSTC